MVVNQWKVAHKREDIASKDHSNVVGLQNLREIWDLAEILLLGTSLDD